MQTNLMSKMVFQKNAKAKQPYHNKTTFYYISEPPESWNFPRWLEKRKHCTGFKKNKSKHLVNNYRPMSPLSLCSKISEKLIFDSIFSFMTHNKLLNNCQSGFRPNDSCINQLISITHNIYRAFDANPSLEVRGVFLDLSKAFDKIWHYQ